jgi:hypothetical protein
MNGNVNYIEKQGKNNECMHMNYKYVVTIMWNNFAQIKFCFYHLTTMIGKYFLCFFIVMTIFIIIFIIIF